ncbi:NAD synthetase [Halalkalibacter wakoensis JCM 9140]|uniref:NAD synthetase n=1 Tax=Halalkalibacter wakoensis JCM 9140 TaxID=1236970 RepID=W4PX83_9BACI|nr:NAD synthetase [Halalkalibacter wakoensis JCM 9140]
MVTQKEIMDDLQTTSSVVPKEQIRKRVDFLKDYLLHTNANGYVLGISGGQDSTLAGKLAQVAIHELNEEQEEKTYSFYAVRLPYGEQKDEADAQDALRFIEPTKAITVNIKAAVDASVEALNKQQVERSYLTSIKEIQKHVNG